MKDNPVAMSRKSGSHLCRRLRRLGRDSEGSALLETVIVLPVLAFFVLVIMEFSLLYNSKQLVNYAAFCAARTASVYGINATEKTHLAAAVTMSSIAPAAVGDPNPALLAYGVGDPDRTVAVLCSIPGFQDGDAEWRARLADAYVRTYLPQCDTGTAPGKTRKHVIVNVTYIYRCRFLPFGNVWGQAAIDAYCDRLRDVFQFHAPGYAYVAPFIEKIRNSWRWNITVHGRAVTDYWAG